MEKVLSRDDLQTSVNGEAWSSTCPFMKIIEANISNKKKNAQGRKILACGDFKDFNTIIS